MRSLRFATVRDLYEAFPTAQEDVGLETGGFVGEPALLDDLAAEVERRHGEVVEVDLGPDGDEVAAVEVDRPHLRASLCASQILGILVARELLALPDLVEADVDTLAAAYGPALQHYLTGEL